MMGGIELNEGTLFVNGQAVGEIHIMDFVEVEAADHDELEFDPTKEMVFTISMTAKNSKRLMRKIKRMVRLALIKQFFHI